MPPNTPCDDPSLLSAIAASVAVIEPSATCRFVYAAANERYLGMLGLTAEEVVGRSPGDVLPAHLAVEFVDRVAECFRTRAPAEQDVVIERDATTTWWRTSMLAMVDEAGRVVRVFVTAIDITDKKKLETAARESRDRLNAVVDSAYDAIITVDGRHQIKFMNAAALRMFGWRASEIIDQSLDLLLPASLGGNHQPYVEAFRRSPLRAREMRERAEILGRRRDGEEFAVQISISKVQLESGIEMTAIVRDVSETARLIAELHATATTDFLTGLATRRRFGEALDTELKRAQRHGRELGLLMMDVDHFKRINDGFGHPVGDAVLAELGHLIARSVRTTDTCGRLGGEEFGILLPETGIAGALDIAERLRAAVERASVDDRRGGVIRFTASVGVAVLTSAASTADELLARADRALYAAKHGGRNRVEQATTPSQAPVSARSATPRVTA